MCFVYILQSQTTGQFYIGSTDNLLRRFRQHQAGYSLATRHRGPWIMPYYEIFATRASAVRRERQLKRWKNAQAITVLIAQGTLAARP